MEIVIGLIVAATMAGVGAAIGNSRGRLMFGLLLGLVVGPIGWFLVYILPSTRIPCPHCRTPVDKKATVCLKCNRSVVSVAA
jgi:hypothetical protein